MKLFLIVALMFSSGSLLAQSPARWGSYSNRPLALQDLVPPDGRRFSLLHDFNYIDQNKRVWAAPTRLIVDGASIPMPFWSVIGGPFEGLYREASIVHDAGCCAEMQPWKDVHHMFYNAMRSSGVGWAKAKTMFLAVWAFGPRWTHLNTSMPATCKIAQRSGTPPPPSSWENLSSDVATGVLGEINKRKLTLSEARAVARPFFTRGPMIDADAAEFVTKLKERSDVTAAERQVIALSVMQSELISEGEVKQAEQWIEKEDPSLETIESRAEEMRNKKVDELRLFPQASALKQSLEAYRLESR
jgi:hypothetical protein